MLRYLFNVDGALYKCVSIWFVFLCELVNAVKIVSLLCVSGFWNSFFFTVVFFVFFFWYKSPGWQGIKKKFVITSKKPFLWAEIDCHDLSCACRQDQLQAAPTSVSAAPGDRQRPCTLPLLGWRWELGAVEVQDTAIVSVTDGTPSSFCKESAVIIVTTGNTQWLLSVLGWEQDGRKGGAWRYIDRYDQRN